MKRPTEYIVVSKIDKDEERTFFSLTDALAYMGWCGVENYELIKFEYPEI